MKPIESVHIIGMDALGLLYGSLITRTLGSGHVSFVMDDDRYDRHQGKQHLVNGEVMEFDVIRASQATPCDLVIVAVKGTGLTAALDTMATSVGPDTTIISVLNGISSEEIIARRYGADRIVHTVAIAMDAMNFGGNLSYTKAGHLCFGVIDPALQPHLDRVTAFCDRAKVEYVVEDIQRRMWSKFMVNVGVNQTCMVYGTGYGGVLQQGSEARMTLISAMREVILLANACGIDVHQDDLLEYLDILASFPADATPSMGQDRINRRPSEVEMFAGTVIRLAKEHNLPVPANEFLYRRVHEIEAEY